MSFDLGLVGQRALVTGGTKGIGAAVVEALLEAGAKVVTSARAIPEAQVEGVLTAAADLSTAEGCKAVADAALSHLGGIDVVVNVVGGSNAPGGGFAALSDGDWDSEISMNLMSAVRTDRALLP